MGRLFSGRSSRCLVKFPPASLLAVEIWEAHFWLHDDFDLDLTELANNVLGPGETATFRLSFSGGMVNNDDQKTYLDNVAIFSYVRVNTLE